MVPCNAWSPAVLPCHGWELCSALDPVRDILSPCRMGGHRRRYMACRRAMSLGLTTMSCSRGTW